MKKKRVISMHMPDVRRRARPLLPSAKEFLHVLFSSRGTLYTARSEAMMARETLDELIEEYGLPRSGLLLRDVGAIDPSMADGWASTEMDLEGW